VYNVIRTVAVKQFVWNSEKDARLRLERGIGFEEIVFHIAIGDLVEILEHPRPERYPGQRIFVVRCREYAHLVPFVEGEEVIVLKTIIPSRRVTKRLREEGKKP